MSKELITKLELIDRKELIEEINIELVSTGAITYKKILAIVQEAKAYQAAAPKDNEIAILQRFMEADGWEDCTQEQYDNHPEWAHKRIVYTAPKNAESEALEKAAMLCEQMQREKNGSFVGRPCTHGTCEISGHIFRRIYSRTNPRHASQQ
jgi:hypothetical protein